MCNIRPMFAIVLAAMLPGLSSGCDVQSRQVDHDEPTSPQPSPWREGAVRVDEEAADIQAAIEHARETADEARERWLKTPESLRTRWAVKWAARAPDGGAEYLWVQPLHWSPFRIEGLLASEPVNRLAAGGHRGDDDQPLGLGDIVAFPIEELADWVHYLEGDPDGPREGGFTIDVLEARYGKPR